MPLENPSRGKFSKLMADHVLRHKQLRELTAVVNEERVANKVRDDRAIPRPSFNGLTVPRLLALDFGQQAEIDVRPLLDGSAHR